MNQNKNTVKSNLEIMEEAVGVAQGKPSEELEKMRSQLLHASQQGGMAKIALDRILGDAIRGQRARATNALLDAFRAGASERQMLTHVARLASAQELELEILGNITRGENATNRLKELENVAKERGIDTANYESYAGL